MERVVPADPAWSATFPHRVAPLSDEWLTGLLLRCDEVNHWESGETFRFLLRATDHPGFGSDASLLVVPLPLLECLAQYLLIDPQRLLATTYATEIARLYPSHEPHPNLLLGPPFLYKNRIRKLKSGRLEFGRKRKIHLCPACIAQTRLIKRAETLPYLKYCPIHHIIFQEHCPCGTSLTFFTRGTAPFTCSKCGLHWAQWPQYEIIPERLKLENDIFALYEFFLSKGTDEVKVTALQLAHQQMSEHQSLQLKLSGRKMLPGTIHALDQLSLGHIVDILVSIGISAQDIVNTLVS